MIGKVIKSGGGPYRERNRFAADVVIGTTCGVFLLMALTAATIWISASLGAGGSFTTVRVQ